MATFTTTPIKTFVSGETVTPVKLNELGQSTVALTAGTIVDADVSASAAIALSKLATGALPTAITVASANLVDGTIVDADVSATAAIVGSKLADAAITTVKLADAGITAAKLSGAQTGSAPIYGCRAWVNFDGTFTNVTGNSYSRTTTTVTVTKSAHGLTTGNKLVISAATDTGLNTTANTASAEITVTDANNFTFQTVSTGASTGTLTYARGIRASGNVASVARTGTGVYTVTFSTAMSDANYALAGFANFTTGSSAGLVTQNNTFAPTASACEIGVASSTTAAGINASHVNVMFIR